MIKKNFDERRTLIIPGNEQETLLFCANQFIAIGKKAIAEAGRFTVALSGGSTPQALFKLLSEPFFLLALDWSKVLLFWSDERSFPPDNSESNYFNAMQSGLSKLPILSNHIYRMHAEEDIEKNAHEYEIIIRKMLPTQDFDLVMLGMG